MSHFFHQKEISIFFLFFSNDVIYTKLSIAIIHTKICHWFQMNFATINEMFLKDAFLATSNIYINIV